MAKLYGENDTIDFAAANLVSFGSSFTRLNGQPIDKSSVWYPKEGSSGYERAAAYAATDAAYVGQVIAVIDDAVSLYVVINEEGKLEKLGTQNEILDLVSLSDDPTVSAESGTVYKKLVFFHAKINQNTEGEANA